MSERDVLKRESILLRILWMAVFFIVWRVGELLLAALVLVQLLFRLLRGKPQAELRAFGDSLSRYLAQIGRFGSFASAEKPWPFADWPAPQVDPAEDQDEVGEPRP